MYFILGFHIFKCVRLVCWTETCSIFWWN